MHDDSFKGRLGGLFPRIEYVEIGEEFSKDDIEALAKLPNLTELVLDNTTVESSSFARLPVVSPDLECLYLANTDIKDADTDMLMRLTSLRVLDLSYTPISDATLENLRAHPTLEVVILCKCSISDTSMQHLVAMPKLHRVVLNRTNITDVGLERLSYSRTLKVLWVEGTGVTPEGVEDFTRRNSRCSVAHDDGTVIQ